MKQSAFKILALICLLAFAACGKDEKTTTTNGGGGGGGGSAPTSQSYSQSVTIPAQKGEEVITLLNLSSSVSSVDTTPSWLVVSPQYYSSGAPTLKLEFEENTEAEERSCTVTIYASNDDKVNLTITQKGTEEKTGIDDVHDQQTDQPAYSPELEYYHTNSSL